MNTNTYFITVWNNRKPYCHPWQHIVIKEHVLWYSVIQSYIHADFKCTIIWALRLSFWLKLFLQILHMYGLWPVWIRKCRRKCHDDRNCRPHTLHDFPICEQSDSLKLSLVFDLSVYNPAKVCEFSRLESERIKTTH